MCPWPFQETLGNFYETAPGFPVNIVSFAEGVSARPERLREIDGLGEAAIVELKIVEAAAKRLAKSAIEKRLTLSTFSAVVDYCRRRWRSP